MYFSLKDENNATLNIALFKNFAKNCKFTLEDGMEVICYGKLSIYKERSYYQLVAEIVELNGIGALLKIIQDRKEKLEKEGLFRIKKPIPKHPKTVGLITAEGGAALQDVLARLENRMPISIYLYPSLMQGKNAPGEIITAINYFNTLDKSKQPMVLVLTRGGGSIEDLMAFNDEQLVRAVANSNIPIITAIGHEIDWTLVDYASDYRLPTPTSVAEFLTLSKIEAKSKLDFLSKKLFRTILKINLNKKKYLDEIFFYMIQNKCNRYKRWITQLDIDCMKFKNAFRLFCQKYKNNLFLLNNININKIIKNCFINTYNKMDMLSLRLNSSVERPTIK